MSQQGRPFEDEQDRDASPSGVRRVRRGRVLLAHDCMTSTCAPLAVALESVLGQVEILDASSVEDALAIVRSTSVDACLVCLDLPPAPMAGARLARAFLRDDYPVVLVTRSLRWLPADAPKLRALPWIAPDASEAEVVRSLTSAFAASGTAPPPGFAALGGSTLDAAQRLRLVRR